MNIKKFATLTELESKIELEKVEYLAFYFQTKNEDFKFDVNDVKKWFSELDYAIPNLSRLKNKLNSSRKFVKNGTEGYYRLHAVTFKGLKATFPDLIKNEEIVEEGSILPERLYKNTRGFIESLAQQINASFENNIFDGCAVLMRRLLETCLILSYEQKGIQDAIKENGNYKLLNSIISNAKTNATLNLSRNSKDCVDDFKNIGNYSAHKIYYNATRKDIENVSIKYRATIEELLYIAGIKK